MLPQALDFRDESDALFALLDTLVDSEWARKTQFKHWTANDIVAHLHMRNYAADLSLKNGDEFINFGRRLTEMGRNSPCHLDPTLGSAESKTAICCCDGSIFTARWSLASSSLNPRSA
jgi:hypothetical protein